MKTIGIVGGVAWPSTLVYYRLINSMIAERLGDNGLHSAKLVIAQTDFAQVEHHQRNGRWDLVGELLAEQARRLQAAGADFYLLACNTVHTATTVVTAIDLPFLHIVDPTAQRVVAEGWSRVGLLGSKYTMFGDYFVGRLQDRYGLDVIVAEGHHADVVHNALYQELARGRFLPETRAAFKLVITDLVDRGAEAVILGCTEFGVLIHPSDSPVPLIDTTHEHARAAVDFALDQDPSLPTV